jgi:mannosyltransferase OCH1-like enzyme
MIPPTILQIVIDQKPNKQEIETRKQYFPAHWNLFIFDEDDMIHFMKSHQSERFPQAFSVYHSFQSFQHRLEVFRYFYLYHHGGIFLNEDIVIAPTAPYIQKVVQTNSFITLRKEDYESGIIGAEPKHTLVGTILDHILSCKPTKLTLNPSYLTSIIQSCIYNKTYPIAYLHIISSHENPIRIADEEDHILFHKKRLFS